MTSDTSFTVAFLQIVPEFATNLTENAMTDSCFFWLKSGSFNSSLKLSGRSSQIDNLDLRFVFLALENPVRYL